MSFSYTEKKRVRRSFEKISSVMELPNLLATQIQSYDAFLQRYVDSDKRLNDGLESLIKKKILVFLVNVQVNMDMGIIMYLRQLSEAQWMKIQV